MDGQTPESGRRGDRRGRTLALRIIRALNREPLGAHSNEFKIGDKRAVMKVAPRSSRFVVTNPMLSRLDFVICAVEVGRHGGQCTVNLYELTADKFRDLSTPSKSKSHARGKGARGVSKRVVIRDGRLFQQGVKFSLPKDPDI